MSPSLVAFTVDLEQDAPPFFRTWVGMEKGVHLLMNLLDDYGIRATFFSTAQTVEKFPEVVSEISKKHEVGCHGLRHERLDRIPAMEQMRTIREATERIEELTGKKPLGFRAPNFKLSSSTLRVIEKLGYEYDASRAVYKPYPWLKNPGTVVEIPNTLPSSVLRLPVGFSERILRTCLRLFPLVVLDYHPWELVEIRGIRWDIRFATGELALRRLREILERLTAWDVEFVRLKEVATWMMGYRDVPQRECSCIL